MADERKLSLNELVASGADDALEQRCALCGGTHFIKLLADAACARTEPTRDAVAEKLWHIDAPPQELNWPDDCRDEERYYCMADAVLALFRAPSEAKP